MFLKPASKAQIRPFRKDYVKSPLGYFSRNFQKSQIKILNHLGQTFTNFLVVIGVRKEDSDALMFPASATLEIPALMLLVIQIALFRGEITKPDCFWHINY